MAISKIKLSSTVDVLHRPLPLVDSLSEHVASLCGWARFFQLCQLRPVRSLLSEVAIVSSSLDHCNNLSYVISDCSLHDAAARVVTSHVIRSHLTGVGAKLIGIWHLVKFKLETIV